MAKTAKKTIKVKEPVIEIEKDYKHDIVKDSTKLRIALTNRWKECGMTQAAISLDAEERGQIGITRQAINKYLRNPYAKGALNQQQILWLSWRWYVPTSLSVGFPDTKVNHVIPDKFNEKEALKWVKKLYSK